MVHWCVLVYCGRHEVGIGMAKALPTVDVVWFAEH
jgi:hypothetical protein